MPCSRTQLGAAKHLPPQSFSNSLFPSSLPHLPLPVLSNLQSPSPSFHLSPFFNVFIIFYLILSAISYPIVPLLLHLFPVLSVFYHHLIFIFTYLPSAFMTPLEVTSILPTIPFSILCLYHICFVSLTACLPKLSLTLLPLTTSLHLSLFPSFFLSSESSLTPPSGPSLLASLSLSLPCCQVVTHWRRAAKDLVHTHTHTHTPWSAKSTACRPHAARTAHTVHAHAHTHTHTYKDTVEGQGYGSWVRNMTHTDTDTHTHTMLCQPSEEQQTVCWVTPVEQKHQVKPPTHRRTHTHTHTVQCLFWHPVVINCFHVSL